MSINKDRLELLRARAKARAAKPENKDTYPSVFVADTADAMALIDALVMTCEGQRFVLNSGAIEKSSLNADGELVTAYAVKSARNRKPSRTAQVYDTVDEVKVCLKNFTREQMESAIAASGIDAEIEDSD